MRKRKNYSPEFKAKVALEGIREEMMLAGLSRNIVCIRRRSARENMATAFTLRSSAPDTPYYSLKVPRSHQKVVFTFGCALNNSLAIRQFPQL